MTIEISNESNTSCNEKELISLATYAISKMRLDKQSDLGIRLVTNSEMASLNKRWMGEEGATDVLSFPIDGGEVLEVVSGPSGGTRGPDRSPPDRGDMPLLLGDIVICPEVAVAQAPTHAGNVDDELALLVVHGVLHILGWDHADAESTLRMQAREREILSAHHWHGPVPATFNQTVPEES